MYRLDTKLTIDLYYVGKSQFIEKQRLRAPSHCTGKMTQNIYMSGKTGNLGIRSKTQGILFAQVVSFLILKANDIATFGVIFFLRSWIGLPIQFCVCKSHKLWKLARGKFAVGQGKIQGKHGNSKIQFA